MTQEALKLALEALISCELSNYGRDWVWTVTAHEQAMKNVKEAIATIKEALADHAMQEVQRLGQEIEPDDIASILACRDMLDAQPVPPQRKPLTDEEIDVIDEATWDEDHKSWGIHDFARAIEAAHGIKGDA